MSDRAPISRLDRAGRHRAIARSAVRVMGITVTVLGLHALLPLPDRGIGAVVTLLAGLVLLTVVVVAQVRAIRSSSLPGLRAIEALALSVVLLAAVFAFAYVSLSDVSSGAFSEPLGRVAGIYFSATVIGTVGFGDITAVTDTARLLVTFQIAVDLAVLAGLVRLLAGVVRDAASQRDDG